MAPITDLTLHTLASEQHGLVTSGQARAAGLSRAAWRHRLAKGEWELVTPRVARRTGSTRGLHQRLMTAVLDVGSPAYLSHGTAAALWGLNGFEPEPAHVVVLRDGAETPTCAGIAHRPRHLAEPFAATLEGLPVIRPSLLVLQLAATVSSARLRVIFDRLWSRRLLSGPSVRRELVGVMHRGRAGTAALRELLDALPADYVPPATGLESRADQILRDAGFGPMRRQVDLGDEAQWCGRVDLLDPKAPLVLEVDSERYHAALTDQAHDAAREARLAASGFVVVRVTDHQVWHHPDDVVERYAAAHRALRRRLAC